jgi:hypothetical protein
MKRIVFLLAFVFLAGSSNVMFGQADENVNPWVYETELQVPWSRVDSLMKLLNILENEYDWFNKAVEIGPVLDIRIHIHHTGNVWNVKYQWIYPTWEAISKGINGKKVWEAVEPDVEKRKAINGGMNWVFNDIPHQDNIYQLVVGSQ